MMKRAAKKGSNSVQETPLMKQYNAIKAKYPGTLLLFRVGDFYETFGEDAVTASGILGIVLTKRANGYASEIELAGFPYHSLDTYLHKLVKAGQRVAICEQLEDPKMVKGIVKRGVSEIITPGVALNDKMLEQKTNNYLACVFFAEPNRVGAAFADVSTGDFFCLSGSLDKIEKLLYNLKPAEVVVARKDLKDFRALFGEDFYTFRMEDWAFDGKYAFEKLTHHFRVSSLKGFGLDEEPAATVAAGVILHYLSTNEQNNIAHLSRLYLFDDSEFVALDKFTIRNLELLSPLYPDGRSFFDVVDATSTPMGARMLKRWIAFPLKNKDQIEKRLNKTEALLAKPSLSADLTALLKGMGDVERMLARLATRKISPRECVQLRKALETMPLLFEKLANEAGEGFRDLLAQTQSVAEPLTILQTRLMDECPVAVEKGSVTRDGVSEELDELRGLKNDATSALKGIEKREALRAGIASLKVGFNNVFGYYIEITNTHKDKVPTDYIRKQTLTNAERYITPELKVFEEKVLGAEEKILVLEAQLYTETLELLVPFLPPLQKNATLVAGLDVLLSFAQTARERKYVRPTVDDGDRIEIKAGRHPVIETLLPKDSPYIPNDVTTDANDAQILIITGPNMAGKSALLRQTALITLMAQMGCYVPAEAAHIGLVDRIFTRVGASDNLSAGESTFMVEMNETARIVNQATHKSLILLDEIGRGTSTYDGISIAWSLVEFLHNEARCAARTLFATHYHELAELANRYPRIRNFNVSVKEIDGKIVFMRKLKPGGSEHSFGIHVAEMAGMPPEIVRRAHELLAEFEETRVHNQEKARRIEPKIVEQKVQMKLFEVPDELGGKVKRLLSKIDLNRITPVEAMLKLIEIHQLFDKKANYGATLPVVEEPEGKFNS